MVSVYFSTSKIFPKKNAARSLCQVKTDSFCGLVLLGRSVVVKCIYLFVSSTGLGSIGCKMCSTERVKIGAVGRRQLPVSVNDERTIDVRTG